MVIRDSSLVDVSIDAAEAAVLRIGADPMVAVALGTPTVRAEDTDRPDGTEREATLRVHLGQPVRQMQKAQVPVSWSMPPGLEHFDGLSGELEIADEGAARTKLTLRVTCAPDINEPSRKDTLRSLQEISQATLRSIEGVMGATTSW